MKRLFLAFLCLGGIGLAHADECVIDVGVNDNLAFAPTTITISKSSCKNVTVNLKHSGKIAKNAMGHNWVLAKKSDAQSLAQAGWSAGLDNNYLPPNDARALAFTKIIGGGESTSITFDTATLEAGGDYTFFCSFVGHYFSMNGVFNVTA